MADLFEPVRLEGTDFQNLLELLEKAFSLYAAALVADEQSPVPTIEILDQTRAGFTDEAWERLQTAVESFHQMMLFAFEDAPDDLISRWARDYEESLQDEAVKRVRLIRDRMPTLRRLWESKRSSVVPILNSFDYEVIYSSESSDANILLAITVSRQPFLARSARSRTDSITIRLWPSDVALLKREIDHILEAHFRLGDQGGEGS